MTMRNTNGREIATLDAAEFGAAAQAPVAVQIPVHRGSISAIAALDDQHLLVTNHGGDSVSIIDTDSWRVADTIPGIAEPFAVAATAADRAYVSTVSPAYDSIQVIDLATHTVIATHPVKLSVTDLAAGQDGKHVYLCRNGVRKADVAVLDTATGAVQMIDIATAAGTTTECVRVSPDGTRLYVGVNGPSGGQLVVIETATDPARRRRGRATAGPKMIGTVDVGSTVRDVAVSPDGARVYIAGCGTDFGAVVDVVDVTDTRNHKIIGTRKIAEVTGLLTRMTLSADGDRAYLVSDDSVTMLCTLTQDVIDCVNVATQPSCVVESRDGRYLYIADYSGVVTVVPISAAAERRPQAALESRRSVDLFVPDLLRYDAALV